MVGQQALGTSLWPAFAFLAGFQVHATMPSILFYIIFKILKMWILGIELRDSCLQNKHFII